MTITLQLGPVVGGHKTAALVETSGKKIGKFGCQSIWIAKRPLAILVAKGQNIDAFDMSGRSLSQDQIHRLCPGALDRFKGAAKP